MPQETITLELTPYQARTVRWALTRALNVTPSTLRTQTFWDKLNEAADTVDDATEHLPLFDVPSYKRLVYAPRPRKFTSRAAKLLVYPAPRSS